VRFLVKLLLLVLHGTNAERGGSQWWKCYSDEGGLALRMVRRLNTIAFHFFFFSGEVLADDGDAIATIADPMVTLLLRVSSPMLQVRSGARVTYCCCLKVVLPCLCVAGV